MIPPRCRAFVRAAPVVAALSVPALSAANRPEQPTVETKVINSGDLTGNRAGDVPQAGIDGAMRAADVGLHGAGGIPTRAVQPDDERIQKLSGRVVESNGQVLYVLTQPGAVVPLDLSALPLREMPRQGDQVMATYQVENRVENVALSLSGRS
ncbi:hypothetical protein LY474_11790 [Myxococcus stipitatus]|uniref:hypothetical protein n=1 Tax=Myxococcus stipitatus TaxID=83455 RepID=UPI001F36AB80|nr:hypothetical protein [Myxococcus stipitatus]MCE9668494.1 hypothetical protein [Myxococcus stipitatus]